MVDKYKLGSLLQLVHRSSEPVGAENGTIYYNTSLSKFRKYENGAWSDFAAVGAEFMAFKGNWNASTNSPSLTDGTGDTGDVYLVSVAGTQNLGSGALTYAIGDWAFYTGTVWKKAAVSGTGSGSGLSLAEVQATVLSF